jgi:serine/threonine protein phosphatase PrpC
VASAVQELIAAANEAGGIDNITCVLAQVHR